MFTFNKNNQDIQELYKTWNNKEHFDDMMNNLNEKAFDKENINFIDKNTQNKTFMTTKNSNFMNTNSNWNTGTKFNNNFQTDPNINYYNNNSLYQKFIHDKDILEENIIQNSKNMRNIKQNFEKMGIENINEGCKINFDQISIPNTNNNMINTINPLVNTTEMSYIHDQQTNKATKSREKNLRNLDMDNTSMVSSINIYLNRSVSKDKNKSNIKLTFKEDKKDQNTSNLTNNINNKTQYNKINEN